MNELEMYKNSLENTKKVVEEKNKELNHLRELHERALKDYDIELEKSQKAIKYIYENTDFQHDGDDYGYMEWVDLKTNTQDFVETLLDILKGDDKE